ncbi:hypothetical protein [Polynucleobacter sp. JS-Fieb-80-E5]|uniref:hypothetical protein n=1 Tax=Polynucleobacter sp. JS-Fieb-80-E5 TaxID=2081050 RepID=UPI001C0E2EF2|nr:hypothetical protein [Polynucleobacter sp. JS-Fieb-80-E5]MBU3617618.1 hypothetical protein [Polynucleobacter sp. JS-Fieb-80-E5]
MRTIHQSTVITPTEPLELLVIDYWQDKGDNLSVCKMIQSIPVIAIKINTYEQTYQNSDGLDLFTETRYITPKGEIDLDEFTMMQTVKPDNSLACLSVIALRTRGSTQVCLLEPPSSNGWLNYSSLSVNPNLYTTYSSGERHPTLVELDQLLKDLEETFPAITEFNTGDLEAGA